jgi:hypothetical protein
MAANLNHDPRAGEAAHRFVRILNELHALGQVGFATMLDSASPEEITRLLEAARVIQASIDRTKAIL